MRLKKIEESKLQISVSDRVNNTSKSLTVYDCTVDEMIKAITEMIENKTK